MQRLRENALQMPLSNTFPAMTIMTDESSTQIILVAFKKAKADAWREKLSNVNITMRNFNISV